MHCNAIKKPENVKAFPAMGVLAAAGTTYIYKMWSKKQSDKRASLAIEISQPSRKRHTMQIQIGTDKNRVGIHAPYVFVV